MMFYKDYNSSTVYKLLQSDVIHLAQKHKMLHRKNEGWSLIYSWSRGPGYDHGSWKQIKYLNDNLA